MSDDPKVGPIDDAKPVEEINYSKVGLALSRIVALVEGDGKDDAHWDRLRRRFSFKTIDEAKQAVADLQTHAEDFATLGPSADIKVNVTKAIARFL